MEKKIITCYKCGIKFEDINFNLKKFGKTERLYCNDCVNQLVQLQPISS